MSTEKMTSDEQLDYDNYRDAKTTKQQQNVAETNERVKRTLTVPQFVLGLFVSCCLTAVLTAVFQWNVGYNLSKFLGIVASDTPSGGEMYRSISAQNEKDEINRDVAKKLFVNNRDIMKGLRDKIEHLNTVVEQTQNKNAGMREGIRRKDKAIEKLQDANKKLLDQTAADKMMEEALSVIALNIVPLNLQKYIGVAHDDQWVWFVNLACDRNAYNVVNTVRNIPKLMAIKPVSERIAKYEDEFKIINIAKSKFLYKKATAK